MSESMIASSICKEVEDITAISWERTVAETQKDSTLSALLNTLKSPKDEEQEFKPELSEYTEYLNSLYVAGDKILYRDRAVIPSSLRKHVVDSLHAAHQGVSTMKLRAQSIVFWPGMTRAIQQVCQDIREAQRIC